MLNRGADSFAQTGGASFQSFRFGRPLSAVPAIRSLALALPIGCCGIERKLSLGSFPNVTLQQAGESAITPRELDVGIDPGEEKRQKWLQAGLTAKTTFGLGAEDGAGRAGACHYNEGALIPGEATTRRG